MRLLLMGVASMHYHNDPVEPALEELSVGLELELVRHDTCRVCKHAILGDDSITFDATRTGHVIIFLQTSHDVRSLSGNGVEYEHSQQHTRQGQSKYLICGALIHRCIQSGSDIIAGAVIRLSFAALAGFDD